MRRVAFFAHYDRDGIIDDYVIYYLRGLQNVASRILFVSDCELKPGEAAKLEGLAELVFAGRHGEYDFGSWKRCFAHLNYDLSGWDELIIANDSCYAPITSFDGMFSIMESDPCDFWGPTMEKNRETRYLNSYFIIFRKAILQDRDYLSFWRKIERLPTKGDIMKKYEFGISKLLLSKGYVDGYIATPRPNTLHFVFPERSSYRSIIPNNFILPFARVLTFRKNEERASNLAAVLKSMSDYYPRSLIDEHMQRVAGTTDPLHYYYRLNINFKWYFFEISGKVKSNRKKPNRPWSWWKLYAYLFGVPVFAFAIPVRAR